MRDSDEPDVRCPPVPGTSRVGMCASHHETHRPLLRTCNGVTAPGTPPRRTAFRRGCALRTRGRFRSGRCRGGRWPHWIPILAPREDRSAPHPAALTLQSRNHAGTAGRIRGVIPNDPPRAPFSSSSGLRGSLLRIIGSRGAPLASDRGSAGLLRVIGSRGAFESPSGAAPARPRNGRPLPGSSAAEVMGWSRSPTSGESLGVGCAARVLAGTPGSAEGALGRLLRTFLSAALLHPPLRPFFSYSEGSRSVAEGEGRSRRGRGRTGESPDLPATDPSRPTKGWMGRMGQMWRRPRAQRPRATAL